MVLTGARLRLGVGVVNVILIAKKADAETALVLA